MATRQQVESEVVARCRVALTLSKTAADPAADASPRAYLNAPLRSGLRAVGLAPANPFAVADADLANPAGDDLDTLIDAATLATLETCLANAGQVDVRSVDVDEKWDQFWKRVEKRIDKLREDVYGGDGSDGRPPEAGVISLGFADRDDGSEFA